MTDIQNLYVKAEELVKRIPGTRKGSTKPAYEHSFDVADRLRRAGCDDEVCVAGLLHDILEDSDTQVGELKAAGFSERVIMLVGLCSHDASLASGDARWVCMMANLVKAQNADAWAIKIADLSSNLVDSAGMPPDRQQFLLNVKAPLMLSLTKASLSGHSLWHVLQQISTVGI